MNQRYYIFIIGLLIGGLVWMRITSLSQMQDVINQYQPQSAFVKSLVPCHFGTTSFRAYVFSSDDCTQLALRDPNYQPTYQTPTYTICMPLGFGEVSCFTK